jgi:hypothetical protein
VWKQRIQVWGGQYEERTIYARKMPLFSRGWAATRAFGEPFPENPVIPQVCQYITIWIIIHIVIYDFGRWTTLPSSLSVGGF